MKAGRAASAPPFTGGWRAGLAVPAIVTPSAVTTSTLTLATLTLAAVTRAALAGLTFERSAFARLVAVAGGRRALLTKGCGAFCG